MKKIKLVRTSLAVALSIVLIACNKDNGSPVTESGNISWTITVGAFSLDNGAYSALGNELIFDSHEECQTWSRTAQGDNHDSNPHSHYNAAADVSYDNNSTTFTWTEYGPETDQSSIESTCSNGTGGVTKSVNDTDYYQDKPNVYLKITSVVEN